jgi:hypothetical protein
LNIIKENTKPKIKKIIEVYYFKIKEEKEEKDEEEED